eukprot:gene50777-25563_t
MPPGLCGPVLRRVVLHDDSPQVRARKEASVPVMLTLGALCAGMLLALGPKQHGANMWSAAMASGAALCWGHAAYALAAQSVSLRLLERWVVGMTLLCLIPVDCTHSAQLLMPVWPFAVLCLDQLLVADAHPAAARLIIVAVAVYLAVERAEFATRFGLYKLSQFGAELAQPYVCDC